MRGIHCSIVHILRDIGCNPKSDILERVESEISELIAEDRDYMFKVAVEKYEEQLRDKGIGGKP